MRVSIMRFSAYHPHPNPPPSEGEGTFAPTPLSLLRGKGLVKRVAAALRKHRLEGKRLLVAVSGGPDSLALLHSLYRAAR